mmetsp:Transcript_18053/g.49825  ORF Transcript_18053/g.49825 Transcript_18053/m.49825 type:complete len:706 (-) Transcript_18053:1975-4092(-)
MLDRWVEVEDKNTTSTGIRNDLVLLTLCQDRVLRAREPAELACNAVQCRFERLHLAELQARVVGQLVLDARALVVEAVGRPGHVGDVDLRELAAHPCHDSVAAQGCGEQLQELENRQPAVDQRVAVASLHAEALLAQQGVGQRVAGLAVCAARGTLQVEEGVVDLLRVVRDVLPAELAHGFGLSVEPHPLGVLEVLHDLAAAPGHAAGVGVHQVAVLPGLHEVPRPATRRGYYGLAGGPGLQDHDAEGLVTAGHNNGVARAEECLQVRTAALQRARKAHGVADPGLVSDAFVRSLEVAVAYNDELRVPSRLQDHGDGPDQDIAALLSGVPADKEEHGVHGVPALVPFGVARPVVVPLHVDDWPSVDPVVDHGHLAAVSAAGALALLLEYAGDCDELVRGAAGATLNVLDAGVPLTHVAVAAALGGVHGEDALLALPFQLLDRGACKPIVAMHEVEGAPDAFMAVQRMHKGAAHVADVLDHAAVAAVGYLVVVDAQDGVVHGSALRAGKDVHLVPRAVQRGRELRDVRRHAAHGDGVQGLPSEHGDLQGPLADDAVLRRLHACDHGLADARASRPHHGLQELAHHPVLIAPLQELPEELGRRAALPEVKAQAPTLDGHAEAWEEGGLIGDRGCLLAQQPALLVHNGVGQPQVLHRRLVHHSGFLHVLFQLLQVLRQPPPTRGVDHGGDAREVEAIEAVLGHPEAEA